MFSIYTTHVFWTIHCLFLSAPYMWVLTSVTRVDPCYLCVLPVCLLYQHLQAVFSTLVAHGYLSHNSCKPSTVVHKSLAIIFCTNMLVGSPLIWAAKHRVHHKYSDSPEDPQDFPGATRFHKRYGWVLSPVRTPTVHNQLNKLVCTFGGWAAVYALTICGGMWQVFIACTVRCISVWYTGGESLLCLYMLTTALGSVCTGVVFGHAHRGGGPVDYDESSPTSLSDTVYVYAARYLTDAIYFHREHHLHPSIAYWRDTPLESRMYRAFAYAGILQDIVCVKRDGT